MCHLPSIGSVDAGCSVVLDVRLRDEDPPIWAGQCGGGPNAEHAMAKGAESAEKVERGIGEPVSTGKEEDA